MTQKDRINYFVRGLLNSALTERQEAVILGQDDNTRESFKNEYKCMNEDTGACSSNLKKCTNYAGHCDKSVNALDCLNSAEPAPRM